MVGLCVCDATPIVEIDGGDGDIVERRAKAIQLLFIPAWAAVVGGLRAVSFILEGCSTHGNGS